MKKITKNIYLNNIINFMKNDYPLIKNMELYGFYDQFSKKELNYVLSGIFEQPVNIRGNNIYNDKGKIIYEEHSDGYWYKREYNQNGNRIYFENSFGYWEKYEYDNNGNQIYEEHSDGDWYKIEYDDKGKIIYWENPNGKIYDNR